MRKLIKSITQNKVEKVVVLYKDRLLRFGVEFVEYIASFYNCDIEIMDNTEQSEQQELVTCGRFRPDNRCLVVKYKENEQIKQENL